MSAMTSVSIPQASSHIQKGLLSPTYEFTKRKRWADLLLTEPADDITFVLSFSCIVLYCSLTVKELLGWKDVDLIDCDLIDLIICATLPLELQDIPFSNSRVLS
jgi:hypothetical protein